MIILAHHTAIILLFYNCHFCDTIILHLSTKYMKQMTGFIILRIKHAKHHKNIVVITRLTESQLHPINWQVVAFIFHLNA